MGNIKEIIKTNIFRLISYPYRDTEFYRLECPDWVNVLPITPDHDVVFVRQYRHGTQEKTLEVPAGQVDDTDSSLQVAAQRELLEETGYSSKSWDYLGWVHPNSAFIDNKCHLFLARDAIKTGTIRNDPYEHTEVELYPLASVKDMIRNGDITHSLVANTFYYYDLFCDKKK